MDLQNPDFAVRDLAGTEHTVVFRKKRKNKENQGGKAAILPFKKRLNV